MPVLDIKVHENGDNCWPDLKNKRLLAGTLAGVARLPHGMQSGKSSVSLRIHLATGEVVIAQTSLELFLAAATAFRAAEESHAGS